MVVTITVGIIALAAGIALGFFIARKYMVDYLKKNPPINEQMLKNDDDANGNEAVTEEN